MHTQTHRIVIDANQSTKRSKYNSSKRSISIDSSESDDGYKYFDDSASDFDRYNTFTLGKETMLFEERALTY
jgi:hypothetical protein